jgi:hypothetical protein
MFRKSVSLVTICAFLVAGCTASTDERPFVRYEPDRSPLMRKAPYHGQYRLYAQATGKPTTRNAAPLHACWLAKGSKIGFEKDTKQQLIAIAGEMSTTGLSPQSGYTWTMQPDPGQIDPVMTAGLVVGIAGAIAGIAFGVAGASAGASLAHAFAK